MKRVTISSVSPEDRDLFLAAVAASKELHSPWVHPPATVDDFHAYVERLDGQRSLGYLIRLNADRSITGVVNINEIVRGQFCSAYLGYYAIAPHEGNGLMREGLRLVIAHAFTKLGLHRLEANIQPENTASIALVRRLGFRKEGFSPRYLHIDGAWRDHERWALTVEEFV
jgi:ribosomal-protein-alanine N-acetyltransferase